MAQSQDVLQLSPASPAIPTGSEKKEEEEQEEEEEEEQETALINDESEYKAPSSGRKLRHDDTQDEESSWNPLKWKWRDYVSFVTLWCTYVFVNASYSMIAPFFPKEAARKGVSSAIIGVIISSAALCIVIFSPVFGYFQPKFGVKFTLLSGLLLVGEHMFYLGWVFIMMCVLLRLTEGVGSAMFETAALTIPPQLFPESVGTVTGLMEVAAGIGYALGPPFGGVLYAAGGFGVPFWVLGGACLFFIPLCFTIIDFKKSSSQQMFTLDLSTLWTLSTSLPFFTLLLGTFLINATFGFPFPVFQPFLNTEFGLNEEKVGLVLLTAPLVFLICALFVGALADKMGPRYIIIIGFLTIGIACFILGPAHFISTPKLWLTIFGYGIIGIGGAIAEVPIYADLLIIAKTLTPEKDTVAVTGLVSGLLVACYAAGMFVGPLVGGALYPVIGFQTSATVCGEFVLAEGFLLLGITLIDRLHRKLTRS